MNPILAEIYSTIVPSMPFIIAAYVLLWILVFVWIAVQFKKQKELDVRLTILEEVAEQQNK